MRIKRYVDSDMRGVLKRVREDAGPDAVILSNRRVDAGIEIIAAVDYDESLMHAFAPARARADSHAADGAVETAAGAGLHGESELGDEPIGIVAANLRLVEPETETEAGGDVAAERDGGAEAAEAGAELAEAAADAGIEGRADAEVETRADVAVEAEAHVDAEVYADVHAQARADAEAQAEARADADAAGELDAEAETESEPEASTDPVPEPDAGIEADDGAGIPTLTETATGAVIDAPGAASRAARIEGASALAGSISLTSMQSEISSMRDWLETQFSSLVWKEQARRQPMRAQMLRNLARIGIAPDIAGLIVNRLDTVTDPKQIWTAPLAELAKLIPTLDDEPAGEHAAGRQKAVALIGPTGVGKTTTIAKIAARHAMRHGSDEIALICADAYRIGAKEHLTAFGQIIGVQVYEAGTPAELAALLDRLQSKRLVLIDTEGISQRDTDLSSRLADYAENADRVRFYLTLSATSQEAGIDETIRRFSSVPLAGAVVSKIDEAGQLGCVISALIRRGLPAVWLTDGQRIPDDLHSADRKRLWFVNQAFDCMEASGPRIDEQSMAARFTGESAAHA